MLAEGAHYIETKAFDVLQEYFVQRVERYKGAR
jgi:hypothetical protein